MDIKREMAMPHAVRAFAWLGYVSLALGVVGSVVLARKLSPSESANIEALGGSSFVTSVQLFAVGVPALLIGLAAFFRQNWARIVFAVLFLFGLAVSVPNLSQMEAQGWQPIANFAVMTLLQGVALYFVFSSDAAAWFKREAR